MFNLRFVYFVIKRGIYMKIAVCDDEQIYLNKIHKELLELEGYAGEFKITEYLSGEDLIADFSAQFIACLIVVSVKMLYQPLLQYIRICDIM